MEEKSPKRELFGGPASFRNQGMAPISASSGEVRGGTWGIRQSGTGRWSSPGDKVVGREDQSGSPDFGVSKIQIVEVILGRPEISRRSVTGWLCVKGKERLEGFYVMLMPVWWEGPHTAARGGRGVP